MHFSKTKLLDVNSFKQALARGDLPITLFKSTIKNGLSQIEQSQSKGISAAEIIEKYTWMIDQLVLIAWKQHLGSVPESIAIELVAVGGYGRAELHPYSDIDLLILLKSNQYNQVKEFIEPFLRFLWDIGFNVGHSVRSIKDCIKEARQDITTMTNLMEGRHISGDKSLFIGLDEQLRGSRIWPSEKYFAVKVQEQESRHAQYQDTAYSLEPNIKESPGGLRDLHSILWIYNRHYGVRSFREMNEQGHINDDEYRILIRARNSLWKIRSSLHLDNSRQEDRLLFDSQREIAKQYGYLDTKNHLAVEQMMKRYYRTAKSVIYLNEVLLAHYRISNNTRFSLTVGRLLDDDFVIKDKLIEQRDSALFNKNPYAMIKLFGLMIEHKINGIHPDTIRAIRANLKYVNNVFRANEKSKTLFIKLFKNEGLGLSNALARMNAYGLLGAYLPTFGAIVGQMQHDLFHVYTVDGHTLMVIQNLIRLREHPDEYPIAGNIMNTLYKPERLFIGALFHDIAKGRGGDHSKLGKVDAAKFCLNHNMSEYDAKLVGWLVMSHLMMSHFSQRRDISDPEVIQEFANIVGDQEHLDNLYLLTLSDIRGTSPKVWNAWKGQLLLDLYKATSKALRRGVAQPINEEEHVKDDKRSALKKLSKHLKSDEYDVKLIEQFWRTLPNDYFIRNEPYYIAWHAAALSQNHSINMPIVSVRYSARLEANMFFIFAPESNELLSKVTASFDKLELNIIEAQLQTNNIGFALYSFKAIVSESESGKELSYMQYLEENIQSLMLSEHHNKAILRRKASRVLKHFPINSCVNFTFNNPTYTVMEVIAQDQPGLLHNVALILRHHNIKLLSAKISTFGEKAEDIFFIQRHDQTPVSDTKLLDDLNSDIISALDRKTPEAVVRLQQIAKQT